MQTNVQHAHVMAHLPIPEVALQQPIVGEGGLVLEGAGRVEFLVAACRGVWSICI
jgi:hypothetical protein